MHNINGDEITAVTLITGKNYLVLGTPSEEAPEGREYWVPLAPANRDYQTVQLWISTGGRVTEEGPPEEE